MIASTFDLRAALYEGVVLFDFIKKDGSLRHARGTTCPDLVPVENVPKGASPKSYLRPVVTFYDIDKKGWRSMRIDTIWSAKRAMKLV